MAAALPLSMFLMSISTILLILNWLAWGNPLRRVKQFLGNPSAWVFFLLFLFHIIGGLYSTDMEFYWEDLRMKVPLAAYPLVLGSTPALSQKQWAITWKIFLSALVGSTLVSLSIHLGIYQVDVESFRDLSPFISHVRLSLLICVGISFLFLQFLKPSEKLLSKLFHLILISWFVYVLNLLESLTGFLILGVLSLITIGWLIFRVRHWLIRYCLFALLIVLPIGLVGNFIAQYFSSKEVWTSPNLEQNTPSGHPYIHDDHIRDTENGHYIFQYICWPELHNEWAKRSALSLDSLQASGYKVGAGLIRYMASKNLRKDSAGLWRLTDEDIKAIERGETNYKYQSGTIRHRIYNSLREFDGYLNGHVNGSSLAQHIEYQRTGWRIFTQQPWFGVGTGDLKIAFDRQYEIDRSSLEPEFRLRAHNQYLSILIAFGIVGGLLFLFTIFFPVFWSKQYNNPYLLAFLLIALISFFSEDTLESQAGVSFFIFFYGLFVWACPKEDHYRY